MRRKVQIVAVVDDDTLEKEITVNGHCVTSEVMRKAGDDLGRVIGHAFADHAELLACRGVASEDG